MAEAARLTSLRVVHAARPVHHDVRATLAESRRTRDGAARIRLAVLVQAVEDWAIVAHREALQLLCKVLLIVGCDLAHEIDILW